MKGILYGRSRLHLNRKEPGVLEQGRDGQIKIGIQGRCIPKSKFTAKDGLMFSNESRADVKLLLTFIVLQNSGLSRVYPERMRFVSLD